MKLLVVANCAGDVIKPLLEATGRVSVDVQTVFTADPAKFDAAYLGAYDLVIAQDARPDRVAFWQAVRQHPNIVKFPLLFFFGFSPDHTAVPLLPEFGAAPIDNMSRIMLGAWRRGLTQDATRALFNPEFISAMVNYRDLEAHRQSFVTSLEKYTPRANNLFDKWYDRGVFFHTGNHPKSYVFEDILRDILITHGVVFPDISLADVIPDPLLRQLAHPNLNHPRARNLLDNPHHVYVRGGRVIPLDAMIAVTFAQLQEQADRLLIKEPDLAQFDTAYTAWTGRTPEPMVNPYGGKPAQHFWSRVVAQPVPAAVTPGDALRPVIGRATRVATAGSCFAQHVARAMVSDGLTYYVAETAPEGMDAATATAQGYGLFSARYGNIYSTRQLLQLIRRAYGSFTPLETAWPVEGGFIDPFRPNIGETFASVAALEAARQDHLAQVRRMFETLDVFVFTLGLTEGWVDRRDGAAYPVTLGAVTKQADPAHFAFQNLDYPAVKADLVAFLGELFAVNPKAQVVLTVSPVPLIATYGADDVLSATTYSKSVLRAAAGDVAALFDAVQYFPSYEIITGGFNRGAYFEDDLRGIRPEGVDHVMRVFRERLVTGAVAAAAPEPTVAADKSAARDAIADEIARQMSVVCDEELLVKGR